jgi:thiamine kinase-like enzyme
VYERLLDGSSLDTPRLYASEVQPHTGRYWMFLERVPGMQLRWTVEKTAWHRAAAWLARAHATLEPRVESDTSPLLIHDAGYYRRWLHRAQAFTAPTDRDRRSRLAWVASHHESVIDVLIGLPRTVIHGEFYPSNILIDESTARGRVSVIDWEMAAMGPAVMDVAALIGGSLAASDQAALVASYRDARLKNGRDASESYGSQALACARLQFAVQWLGWSRDWSPPEEQRHDWLAEAVELGETMGW